MLAGDRDFQTQFGEEVHGIFCAAIDFSVTLLSPVAFDLRHGHALDTDTCEGLADLIQLEWFNDGDDQLHGVLPRARLLRAIFGLRMVLAENRFPLFGDHAHENPPGFGRHGLIRTS